MAGYETILLESVTVAGRDEFVQGYLAFAAARRHDGLPPLWKPAMFLHLPPASESVTTLYERDSAEDGYVTNHTKLWAWRPDLKEAFTEFRKQLATQSTLSDRERAVLVCATASSIGDAYCALAWGTELAQQADPGTAAEVLQMAEAHGLTPRERALMQWARQIVRDPNGTTAGDVESMRKTGLSETEIFDATVLIAFRLAFSTVNDSLGARPDSQLADAAPAEGIHLRRQQADQRQSPTERLVVQRVLE